MRSVLIRRSLSVLSSNAIAWLMILSNASFVMLVEAVAAPNVALLELVKGQRGLLAALLHLLLLSCSSLSSPNNSSVWQSIVFVELNETSLNSLGGIDGGSGGGGGGGGGGERLWSCCCRRCRCTDDDDDDVGMVLLLLLLLLLLWRLLPRLSQLSDGGVIVENAVCSSCMSHRESERVI